MSDIHKQIKELVEIMQFTPYSHSGTIKRDMTRYASFRLCEMHPKGRRYTEEVPEIYEGNNYFFIDQETIKRKFGELTDDELKTKTEMARGRFDKFMRDNFRSRLPLMVEIGYIQPKDYDKNLTHLESITREQYIKYCSMDSGAKSRVAQWFVDTKARDYDDYKRLTKRNPNE